MSRYQVRLTEQRTSAEELLYACSRERLRHVLERVGVRDPDLEGLSLVVQHDQAAGFRVPVGQGEHFLVQVREVRPWLTISECASDADEPHALAGP